MSFLKEEEGKAVVRDKLNALLPDAPKILAETSGKTPKYEIIIPNPDEFFETIEKGRLERRQ